MSKQIFLDLETTGFSRQWDYIIELAAIAYDDTTNTIIDTFHEYIKPGKTIPYNIAQLTGITNSQVRDCRNERAVLRDFVEWLVNIEPDAVVGHNCKTFDLQFIREKCAKYEITFRENFEIIDTLVLARQLVKQNKITVTNCKQPTLAAYFEIEYEAHSAINDVEALIRIYNKMKKLTKPTSREDLGF